MVDVTRLDKITRKDKAANTAPYYSDFYTNFNAHPHNKRLSKYTNEESVKRSVRNLILTDRTERLFQPEIGCGIRDLLFENISDLTTIRLKDEIETTIKRFEPRARVIQTEVYPLEDRNAYDIYIVFEVINSINPVSLNLTLYRVR